MFSKFSKCISLWVTPTRFTFAPAHYSPDHNLKKNTKFGKHKQSPKKFTLDTSTPELWFFYSWILPRIQILFFVIQLTKNLSICYLSNLHPSYKFQCDRWGQVPDISCNQAASQITSGFYIFLHKRHPTSFFPFFTHDNCQLSLENEK
jgi:hypothetical protein